MFTKQHYEKTAETVKEFLQSQEPIEPVDVVAMLVSMFKKDNPNFDEYKFVKACGMNWSEYCLD